MNAEVIDLGVGQKIWLDGQLWSVREHEDGAVVLASADALRRVRAANLIGASVMNHPTTAEPDRELDAVLISSLTPAQRTKVERQRQVLIELCDADRTADSYEEAAKALGVSVRSTYRLATRYQARGVAGLIDPRLLSQRRAVDPDWDATCVSVLDGFRDASNPTMKTVIAKTHAAFRAAFPERRVPSDSVAYLRVRELDKGRYTFAAAKQRRSVAERPAGVLGRLRADRPGQYVVLDSTPLDVFAMEPITLRWVNVELSVGMDLYSRCITGLTLRPVAAKAPDVAGVLYQTVTPQTWGREQSPQEGPYVGVPDAIVTGETGVLPDTIVVDHGKIYLSEHVLGICVRFGMNVQPAIPHKPTDKPTVERFFRTIRQQLLEHLPAYKGPDVYSRGKDVEQHAFLYVSELEQILREWVGIYHHTPHAGLRDPHLPHVDLSPAQMFARGIAQSGMLRLPASEDLVREFLQVEWRTIQHYGVEIRGQRYDGPGLNTHRGGRSPYGGVHAGKWPFMVDPDDVRWVYFKDPDTSGWHRLEWEHAPGLDAPFSQDAADYTRRLSRQSNRFVDPAQAIADLLADWSTQQVTERRDKNLAIRLSAQRAQTIAGAEPLSGRETASDLGVIDFLARRTGQRPPRDADLTDDLDVFDAYYQAHPEGGLEVYEE